MTQKREIRDAIRGRIRDFAAARDLSAEDIKPAMTTKHFELVQFAEKYSVSIEWHRERQYHQDASGAIMKRRRRSYRKRNRQRLTSHARRLKR